MMAQRQLNHPHASVDSSVNSWIVVDGVMVLEHDPFHFAELRAKALVSERLRSGEPVEKEGARSRFRRLAHQFRRISKRLSMKILKQEYAEFENDPRITPDDSVSNRSSIC